MGIPRPDMVVLGYIRGKRTCPHFHTVRLGLDMGMNRHTHATRCLCWGYRRCAIGEPSLLCDCTRRCHRSKWVWSRCRVTVLGLLRVQAGLPILQHVGDGKIAETQKAQRLS